MSQQPSTDSTASSEQTAGQQHRSDPVGEPLALPPVPRPISRRARRRSWAELPVRIWLILAITIGLVTLLFVSTRAYEGLSARWLISRGVNVTATITKVNSDPLKGHGSARSEPLAVAVEFPWKGQTIQLEIPRLEPKKDAFARVGDELPLKVDPNDPYRWTENDTPRPWSQELAAAGFLVPLFVLLMIVVLWKRRGVLQVWANGVAEQARAVDTRHTAAAPMSRILRFTIPSANDRRIRSVLVPASAGIPAPDELIWLIHAPNNPNRAIVAKLYVEGTTDEG